MDIPTLDQYFELALDLGERERERMLVRLEAEDPAMAAQVREMLANPRGSGDFALHPANPTRPDHLHHVAIQVRDIKRAVEWYRSVLTCKVEHEDATWAMLRFDNVRLALVVPEQHPPHVAIVRADAAKFGKLTTHRDGTRSAYIVDPWGNSIEVLDKGSLPNEAPADLSTP